METLKKIFSFLVCTCLMTFQIGSFNVYAEDYSDTAYWSNYCTQSANMTSNVCKGYVQYLQTISETNTNRLQQIESERQQIAANLAAYDAQLKEYQAEIASLQTDINAKQVEIDAKTIEIDEKQAEIDENEAQVEQLETKVKKRIAASQSTMRLSSMIDVLMGASTFTELIRVINGLNAIARYDNEISQQLADLIALLNTQKTALEQARQDLVDAQNTLVAAQNEMIILREAMQVIIDEAEAQAALLEAEGNTISSNLNYIQEVLANIDLNNVAAAGWTFPVPGSYRSAGTWHYPSGGIHLGYDFAADVGTTVRAVGNGVIINSVNGCPTYGGLGSTCGTQYGGSQGGGNQIYMLANINGSLYGVKYLHLMLDSVLPSGTVVSAGDQIGLVGSSGNSSGGHCHIELFFLGDASNLSTYAKTWDGDLTFNTGWANGIYGTYGRRCDDGTGAPCRIRPEAVFSN